MKVIVFEEEAYNNLVKDFARIVKSAIKETAPKSTEKEWLDEKEAKELLGFRSKSKMQQLRDDRLIVFSQHGRTIRYSRKSIVEFLNGNIPSL